MSEDEIPPNVLKPRSWRPLREIAIVPILSAAVACIFVDERQALYAVALAALVYATLAGFWLGVREAKSFAELLLECMGNVAYWIAGGVTALLRCLSVYVWFGVSIRIAEPVALGACLGCATAARWPFVGRLTYEFFADIRHDAAPEIGRRA